MKFSHLGLIAPIVSALKDEGCTEPTPIQECCIPPALTGRDILGCAQNGRGKTCAFILPILQQLNGKNGNPRVVKALVIAPTREVAVQDQADFTAYGKRLSLKTAVIVGGMDQSAQVEQLRRGVDILVATPGRLLDLYQKELVDLSHIQILVLDEAQRMRNANFLQGLYELLEPLPEQKQTMIFTEAMVPVVTDLADRLLQNPARVMEEPPTQPKCVVSMGDQDIVDPYRHDRPTGYRRYASPYGKRRDTSRTWRKPVQKPDTLENAPAQKPDLMEKTPAEKPAPMENREPLPPRNRPARGTRYGRLEDTIPKDPSMPASDFTKPNPLESDKVLDATGRMLAQKKKSKEPWRGKPKHQAPQPAPAGKKKRVNGDRRTYSYGPQRPHYDTHQKDSTEQKSLMRPYYIEHD